MRVEMEEKVFFYPESAFSIISPNMIKVFSPN